MTLVQFFRLVNRNLNLLLLGALALSCGVFFFTYGLPETYQVRTEIYTGLVSGTSVESMDGARMDWLSTNNQFDNLINVVKSDQTLAEVGEVLLAKHLMLDGPSKEQISPESWEGFQQLVPQEFRDSLIDEGGYLATLQNIQRYKDVYFDSHLVNKLFNSKVSPYSTKAISSNLNIKRIGSSDLVEINYSWTDPAICQNTLQILNKVFKQKLLEIKIGQTNDVVDYFHTKVEEARLELVAAEDSLKEFRIRNKIINYEQQTQNIASLQTELEQEYQKELRAQAAARASVKQLEKKLELNKKMVEFSDELLAKRKRLSDINSKIAELEVYYNDPERLGKLRSEAQRLEAELSNNLSRRNQFSKTKEGVSNKEVLQEWLDATIALDASTARLKVLANRGSFFQDAYDEFSPLGSQLSRYERAVDVAERKYLDLNKSLSTALTKQQSESLATGGLVVTVPPKYPLEPVKSKRLLLVLLAAVVGVVIPFTLIFIIEFLDNTIKSVERGEEKTGLKLLGAFPNLDVGTESRNVDMDWLVDKSTSHLIQNIRYEEHKVRGSHLTTSEPFRVLIFSIRDGEGKSKIANLIAGELSSLGKKTLLLSTGSKDEFEESDKFDFVTYKQDKDFLTTNSLVDFVSEDTSIDAHEYLLMDFEAVITEPYPIEVVEKFDLAICVVTSKRAWNKADVFSLEEFSSVLKNKPRLVLNYVEPDYMDSVLGEIRKTRSPIRKLVKAILTLEFRR